MSKKKTQGEVIEILKKYNLKICEGEIYKDVNSPIKCIDSEGYIVYPTISNLQRGQSVRRFNKNNPSTIENIRHYIKYYADNVEGIELTSDEYKGNNKKLIFNCEKHGEFKMRWNSFYSGSRCPKCAIKNRTDKQRKTHEEFVREVEEKYKDKYTILEKYKGIKTKILVRCNSCGHEWKITPDNLLRGKSCPKCVIKNMISKERKTHKEFLREIEKIHGDRYTILEEYINAKSKILVRCNKCGYEWKVIPRKLLYDTGCPKCNQSKGENRIENWLKQNNINFISQYTFEDCKYKQPLLFDFYLPFYNCCIEYDGEQHFKAVDFSGENYERALKIFKETQKRDKIKNEYCKNNNITLLRIPYTKFDNIEIILENFLKEINTNNNHLTNLENMV